MPRRVLVSGGFGFIGSHLVDALMDRDDDVTVFDNLSTGSLGNLPGDVQSRSSFHPCDISQVGSGMLDYFDGIDTVYHLAAKARVQQSIEYPITWHDTNVRGTLIMLHLAAKHNVRRFVFVSSSSVYGQQSDPTQPLEEGMTCHPMSPYGLQKLQGEQYCKLFSQIYGLDTVCIRPFNVYGDRMTRGDGSTVVQRFLDQRAEGKPLTIRGDGTNQRDYTFVGDVVEVLMRAGDRLSPFNALPLNAGRGCPLSINEVAGLVCRPNELHAIRIDSVAEPTVTFADRWALNLELGWQPQTYLSDWLAKRRADGSSDTTSDAPGASST